MPQNRLDSNLQKHLHSGGLEMLFADRRRHELSVPAQDADGKPASVGSLIDHLCNHVMQDGRKDLFVLEGNLYVHLVFSFLPTLLVLL